MEDRINKAIQDIDNIRNMMEESKVHYLGFARLSVIYGIYCLIESVMLFCSIYLSKYIYIILILRIGMLFLLIGSFIYIYRTESKCRNRYNLSLYGIWATLGIMLPVMLTCTNIICNLFGAKSTFNIKNTFDVVGLPVNVVLFCVFLLVCAFVTEKRILISVSGVILFAYIMLSTVWWDRGINVPMPMSNDAVVTFSYIYHVLFICGGYIIAGLYLWRRNRHDD